MTQEQIVKGKEISEEIKNTEILRDRLKFCISLEIHITSPSGIETGRKDSFSFVNGMSSSLDAFISGLEGKIQALKKQLEEL